MTRALVGALALLHGAAAAVNTANALRPVARRGPLAIPSFAAGALTTELPRAAARGEADVRGGAGDLP
ncbi:hypothetical protein [Cryptosporangium aurantiacum]|uniref:Uncharacterized protein n=1 Tax=Cryptosporangium aurantiacum TaxID=134849 RepID=A0A1M7RPS8_9ACTN|nr:hypothetical protein [Cryptosporangium aurantiacum]SHN48092.1 hypothetical protein SAMN05443668_13339 [Cryptosporangium aurantiacum]